MAAENLSDSLIVPTRFYSAMNGSYIKKSWDAAVDFPCEHLCRTSAAAG